MVQQVDLIISTRRRLQPEAQNVPRMIHVLLKICIKYLAMMLTSNTGDDTDIKYWRWYWHQILGDDTDIKYWWRIDDTNNKYWRWCWHPHYQGQLQEEPLPTGGRCIEHWTLDGELHIQSLWPQKTYYHCYQSLLAMQSTRRFLDMVWPLIALGWEMRFTEDHVRYFVDHNTR